MTEGSKRLRDVAIVGRGIQPSHVRQTNQRAVLSVISLQPGISNAELARVVDLAPQTVSAVLVDLENAGLITRGEVRRGRRGQPATPFYLKPEGAYCVGVEIGWSRLEVCLVGIGTQVISCRRRPHAFPDARTVFEEVSEAVREVTANLSSEDRRRLVGLGLAMPGGIGDPASLLTPPPGQRQLWASVDAVRRVATATSLDVTLFNDGSAACWAQRVAHPAPRPLGFVYLLVDTFVGAGIVAENRLWEGIGSGSGNLGSMLVTDRHGRTRFLHQVASLHALGQRLEPLGVTLEAALSDRPPVRAAKAVHAWLEEAAYGLAQTIINTARVLEFELAVLEAELPEALRHRLLAATRAEIEKFPTLGRTAPPLIAGHLGRSGAAQGAALLCMHRRYFSREIVHMDA